MPAAIATFFVTLVVEAIAAATLTVAAFKAAFIAAAVVASVDLVTRALIGKERGRDLTGSLPDRRTNLRIATPPRKIVYGHAEVGGAVFDIAIYGGGSGKPLAVYMALADNKLLFHRFYFGGELVVQYSQAQAEGHAVVSSSHTPNGLVSQADDAITRGNGTIPSNGRVIFSSPERAGEENRIPGIGDKINRVNADIPGSSIYIPINARANNDGTEVSWAAMVLWNQSPALPSYSPDAIAWYAIPGLTAEVEGYTHPDTLTTLLAKVSSSVSSQIRNGEGVLQISEFNAAYCALDYILRHTDYANDILNTSRIDWDSVGQAILDCDTMNLDVRAVIALTDRPEDVLSHFAFAMNNGSVYDVGGVLHMRVGKVAASTLTLTEDEVLSWEFLPSLPRDLRADSITVQYEGLAAADGDVPQGRAKIETASLSLPASLVRGEGTGINRDITAVFAATKEQALNAATNMVLTEQRSRELKITTSYKAMGLEPWDVITLGLPTIGVGQTKWRVREVSINPNLTVGLVLHEELDDNWQSYDTLDINYLTTEGGEPILTEDGDHLIWS